MECLPQKTRSRQQPLRALIEIDRGELRIFPVGDSDEETMRILDGLRFVHLEGAEG